MSRIKVWINFFRQLDSLNLMRERLLKADVLPAPDIDYSNQFSAIIDVGCFEYRRLRDRKFCRVIVKVVLSSNLMHLLIQLTNLIFSDFFYSYNLYFIIPFFTVVLLIIRYYVY